MNQGGDIAFGFFVVGCIVSFLVGYFADTINRTILFSVLVFFGELSCLLTYFTTTYMQLFICRIFTGISIGKYTI